MYMEYINKLIDEMDKFFTYSSIIMDGTVKGFNLIDEIKGLGKYMSIYNL
jgi:hypothetical protein